MCLRLRLPLPFVFLTLLSLVSGASAASGPSQRQVLDPRDMQLNISPRVDFYQYANGGWLQREQLPDDHGRWGTFEELDDRINATLKDIVEEVAGAPAPAGSIRQQVGDFYRSGMNTEAIEAAGLAPLQPWRERIAAVHDAASLAQAVAELHRIGALPLFALGASPDAKNANLVIAQVSQAGLGLAERDQYLNPNDANLRHAYHGHLTNMFTLLGQDVDHAGQSAAAVLSVETELARASLNAVARRDPIATYNKTTLAALSRTAAGFDWAAYMAALHIDPATPINVESLAFVIRVGSLAESTSWEIWQTYLTWHLVHRAAPFLTQAFVQENFAFYGKVVAGTPALPPRYKRVLTSLDTYLGEALGQLYVAKAFSPHAKDQALVLVANIRAALTQRVQGLSWMGEDTKARALEKVDKLTVKVGYPDTWIDYRALPIGGSYLQNVFYASCFAADRALEQLGLPPDRSRWDMTPQTVNAYYNPQANEIVFPAGILQYPFFDADADDAFNFGAIGGVIGHELSHGFDDQGRLFDADGNMNNWWREADADAFDARRRLIVQQFDGYTLFDKPVNGSLTQGENIADLGGLTIAFAALENSLAAQGRASVDGWTPEQRFFLAWAQIWRNHVRPETAAQRLLVDPHAPGRWRVNGPLANMPQFYAAFGVQPGDAMYRAAADRVVIW